MQRKVVFVTGILLITVSLCLAGGYLGAKWGMSPKEVKAAFPDKKWKGKEKRGYIYFEDKLLDLKVMRKFSFSKKGLSEVSIEPVLKIKMTSIIETFKILRGSMRKKYGDPKDGNCSELGDSAESFKSVMSGQAECHEKWEMEDTTIKLQLGRIRTAYSNMLMWKPLLLYTHKKKDDPAKGAPDLSDQI